MNYPNRFNFVLEYDEARHVLLQSPLSQFGYEIPVLLSIHRADLTRTTHIKLTTPSPGRSLPLLGSASHQWLGRKQLDAGCKRGLC